MRDDIAQERDVIIAGALVRAAFDYLLAHAEAAGFTLVSRTTGAVKAVEFQRRGERRNSFAAQAARMHLNFYLRGPILAEVLSV